MTSLAIEHGVDITKERAKEKRRKFIRALFKRKIVLVSFIGVCVFILIGIFAPLLAPYDIYTTSLMETLQRPSAAHLLGTDDAGRDILSRLIFGTRVSLVVGVLAVIIACCIGTFFGMLAGYSGGIVDDVINRTSEAVRVIPQIVLAMTLTAIFGGGIISLAVVLGISNTTVYIRMMRSQVLTIRETDYIMAAVLQGNSKLKIMFRHVLPNSISPIIVIMTQQIGSTILAEAGLSFLGLGISQPMASWGSIVSGGKDYLMTNPAFSMAPGICIALLVIFMNILGDGIRDVLDPRLRGDV
ncbi:MAG: ABC transporter permease [Lachnospiraceae bacterium]